MSNVIRLIFVALSMGALALQVRATPIALVNGRMLDVEHRKVLSNVTVLIDEGRILDVGARDRVRIPASAASIDALGKWIMPGLVDAHIHLFQSGGLYTRPDVIDLRRFRPYEQERAWVREHAGDLLARYLAAGVTTVIDVGGPMSNYALRDRFTTDTRSPTIHLTGPLISTYQPPAFGIDDPPIIESSTPEEARELVRRQLPHRPEFIKIWYLVRPDRSAQSTLPMIQAAIDEAHRHELKVAVHATQLETAKLALRAGADFLVHGIDDAPIDKEFMSLLSQRRAAYIPTLVVTRNYDEVLSRQFKPSAEGLALANPYTVGTLSDLEHLTQKGYSPPERKPVSPDRQRIRLQNLRAVKDAGALIATGTDAGNIGTLHASSYLEEILEMRAAGLDAWDILQASTINGAKVLGQQRDTGSIVRGKRADLLLLDRNPLEDLRNLRSVHRVINRGTVLDPAALIDNSPEALVQRQLNAYNARDIDAFIEPYAENVQVYHYPGRFQYEGKSKMREHYAEFFNRAPRGLHCEVVERIVVGNTVIDHEHVTSAAGEVIRAIAIHTIEGSKISRVELVMRP